MSVELEPAWHRPVSGPEEVSFRDAYRRGSVLLLIVVFFTAAWLFQDAVNTVRSEGMNSFKHGGLLGWLIDGWICWAAYRGGRFARICFAFMYSLALMAFVTAFTFLVASHLFPPADDSGFHLDQDWWSTLLFAGVGAWTVFSVWVLLISKDVRIYMKVRRRGLGEGEALAYEWKRFRQEQERSPNAS